MGVTRVVVVGVVAVCFVVAPAAAAQQSTAEVPPGITAYHDDLLAEVRHLVDIDGSGMGFTDPVGAIHIGPLRPVFIPTRAVARRGPDVPPSQGMTPSDEWVAAVYQNGVARNVVGVWEPAPGKIEMSSFGHGGRLARSLERLPAQHLLLHEAPIDAWYGVAGETVTVLSGGNADQQTGSTTSWAAFADAYEARREAMIPDGTMSPRPTPWAALAGMAALIALLVAVDRWRARRLAI